MMGTLRRAATRACLNLGHCSLNVGLALPNALFRLLPFWNCHG